LVYSLEVEINLNSNLEEGVSKLTCPLFVSKGTEDGTSKIKF
jgi:hypothetical protein